MVITTLILGALAGAAISAFIPHQRISETTESTYANLFPINRLPVDAAVRLRLWNLLEDGDYLDYMQHQGYGADTAGLIIDSARVYMDAGQVVRVGWRQGKDDAEIVNEVVAHGWNKEDAEKFVFAAHPFPSMGDLVTWMAHEVYEPDQISTYGLDAEFEGLNLDDAHKIGMTDDMARNYWRSHWVHPSYNQIAEMVHRGVVPESIFSDWFRLVEITPFWRDKLIKISYNPYTRVDVRRMHAMGTLSDSELVRAYMDYGYDREHAEKMAEFTIAYNASGSDQTKRDLTRASLEKARRYGVISSGEFSTALTEMGYSEGDAGLLSALVEQDLAMSDVDVWVSLYRSQVKSGLITPEEAGTKLAALGLADDVVQTYIQLFTAYSVEPTKLPSKTDVKAWLKAEVISEAEAKTLLDQLGYQQAHIDNYLATWQAG